MTDEPLGERGELYRKQIEETRRYSLGVVSENNPLMETGMMKDRSSIFIRCDNGISLGFYGPRSLQVGTPVEVYEFRCYRDWDCDYRILHDAAE